MTRTLSLAPDVLHQPFAAAAAPREASAVLAPPGALQLVREKRVGSGVDGVAPHGALTEPDCKFAQKKKKKKVVRGGGARLFYASKDDGRETDNQSGAEWREFEESK